MLYTVPGQKSQAGRSGGLRPRHRHVLFSLHRVYKTGTCCQYLKTETFKKFTFLDSFEEFLNLAAVKHSFYMSVSPWWELSCSFERGGPLLLTGVDQWRGDACVAGGVKMEEEKIF